MDRPGGWAGVRRGPTPTFYNTGASADPAVAAWREDTGNSGCSENMLYGRNAWLCPLLRSVTIYPIHVTVEVAGSAPESCRRVADLARPFLPGAVPVRRSPPQRSEGPRGPVLSPGVGPPARPVRRLTPSDNPASTGGADAPVVPPTPRPRLGGQVVPHRPPVRRGPPLRPP